MLQHASSPRLPTPRPRPAIIVARWVLVAVYLLAGVIHLRNPHFFMKITPAWVPQPQAVILATGACEIAGALALLFPRTRKLAGVMLALYAVCVFPANVKHAIDDLSAATGLSVWYHAPRLLAQPFIVWWALIAGDVTRWPFGRTN